MRLSIFIAAFAAFVLPAGAGATEEPQYTLIARDGPIEIRDYAPVIVAEVQVDGSRRAASGRGFRPLANYIFGGNAPRSEIAMTAPVTTSRRGRSGQEIAMTAPVTTEPGEGGGWTVAFIMPSEWTMETLPAPNDPSVTLREEPAKRVAAIAFSGYAGDRTVARAESLLLAYLQEAGLTPVSEPSYAYYDAPWVPGPLRRNEVMVEIGTE
ncbi:MAG: heme-binding protein [Pseudomonadota bacterium]